MGVEESSKSNGCTRFGVAVMARMVAMVNVKDILIVMDRGWGLVIAPLNVMMVVMVRKGIIMELL